MSTLSVGALLLSHTELRANDDVTTRGIVSEKIAVSVAFPSLRCVKFVFTPCALTMQKAGLKPAAPLITYCQSGMRAVRLLAAAAAN